MGIISKGQLIAEASQEELLQRYAVPAFEIEIDPTSKEKLHGWVEKLRSLPWILDIVVDNLSARITINDIETAKRELLATTIQSGLILTRYEIARPSLEDIFLHLTGGTQT